MRLDMWMIANRLEGLDYETHIRASTPRVLHSARLVYAPNCICLSQRGEDVYCRFEDDFIIVHGMDIKYVFELIQGAFDTYDDWYTRIIALAQRNDWQSAIDELSFMLRNPVVFFDANNRVIAMSTQYDDFEIDEEWKYLRTHGVSSAPMMHLGRRNVEQANNFELLVQKEPPTHMRCGLITSRIAESDTTYGYISSLEVTRSFNEGDHNLLRIFTEVLTSPFVFFSKTRMDNASCNCFTQMLLGHSFDAEAAERQLGYYGLQTGDRFRVMLVSVHKSDHMEDDLRFIRQIVLMNYTPVPVMRVGDYVAVISGSEQITEKLLERIRLLTESVPLQVGVSSLSHSIWELDSLYKQAVFVMNHPPEKEEIVRFFERAALDYLVLCRDREDMLRACHEGMRQIYEHGSEQDMELLRSLELYLMHERSLTYASKALFVHKNTLLYRIQKIESLCGCHLEDAYEREYILQSLRVLRLLTK